MHSQFEASTQKTIFLNIRLQYIMSIFYQEITDELFVPDCVAIQYDIFGLSEKDAFPAAFFSLLIRKEHPLGMLVGCFKQDNGINKLIGLAAFMTDSKPNTLYCLFMGVDKAHRDSIYGFRLSCKVKEIAQKKGIKTIYGIYDPLEANLGRLYAHLGVVAVKYLQKPYKLYTANVIQVDKVLFEWEMSDKKSCNVPSDYKEMTLHEIVNELGVVEHTKSTKESFLVEIPSNYLQLTNRNRELAANWRHQTQKLFSYYLNEKNYHITNCFSGKIDSNQKTFYLLQKSN